MSAYCFGFHYPGYQNRSNRPGLCYADARSRAGTLRDSEMKAALLLSSAYAACLVLGAMPARSRTVAC